MSVFTESVVEQAALAWLGSAGWRVLHGVEIALGEPAAKRADYGQVVRAQRLHDALARLNVSSEVAATNDWAIRSTSDERGEPA